jgi:hypothetical protein
VAPAFWDASPWFVKLAVRLLAEQRQGPGSARHQWLQQLPQQVRWGLLRVCGAPRVHAHAHAHVHAHVHVVARTCGRCARALDAWLRLMPWCCCRCVVAAGRQVDSLVHWAPGQLALLRYPPLEAKAAAQQAEWGQLYDTLCREGLVNQAAAPPSKQASVLQGCCTLCRKHACMPAPRLPCCAGVSHAHPLAHVHTRARPPPCPVTPTRHTHTRQEFLRALSLVRSRTFSGPYVASTLQDRLRLGGLVGALVVLNSAVFGGSLSKGLGAAAAVFLFNIIYELLLSSKLRQYAMCPVIDLANHSSIDTVRVSVLLAVLVHTRVSHDITPHHAMSRLLTHHSMATE